jgi:dienelactone hydrolase
MKPARIALLCLAAQMAFAQSPDARQQLNAWLNEIGFAQLKTRAETVAAIRTREQAERRKQAVRDKILKLIGGLPDRRGPVPVRQFGSLPGDGFRVEKIAYESLPGFFVTADVYIPAGPGPFPAVLLTPGHEPTAKQSQYNWGANLARAGILSLAVDPMGQGERLQNYNLEKKQSEAGQGTGEHGVAAYSTMLIGDHVSRYFINDGMRGVDYLTARKDVDAAHIGAFGCSGGGTATAYLAAMDDRIKVAATACYITSFQELLPAGGPQEAEQSIPGFLAEGLDFGDWVELAAPKPYAVVSTTEDMFPIAGANWTFDEAQRIYGLYGAGDRIQHIVGPGRHGNLGPIGGQIVAFLVRWLKKDAATPEFQQFHIENPASLNVTETGQIATSLHGETIEEINRKRALPLLAPAGAKPLARLRDDIRALTHAAAQPGADAASASVVKTEQHDGYRVDTLLIRSEPGAEIPALLAAPKQPGPHPATLILDEAAKETTVQGPIFAAAAAAGRVVLILQPRGTPGPNNGGYLGPFNLISLRALLVGRNLVGLRIDDTLRAVNWLCNRPDVDRAHVSAWATGPMGVVLLHTAVLDPRISEITVDHTLRSYRLALDAPIHRNLPAIAIPGVLRYYDLPDLVAAIGPHPVTITHPVNALGEEMSAQ